MKLLGAICLVLTALGFCSGENKNCFIELDEEIAKLECPVGKCIKIIIYSSAETKNYSRKPSVNSFK